MTIGTKSALSGELVDSTLSHVARYRLTMPAVLSRLRQFSTAKPREMETLLNSLTDRSLVAAAPLVQRQRYWHLTALGARRCGVPENYSGPLSEPAKIKAYAVLQFCCLGDRPRHLLTGAELGQHFPNLQRPGLPAGYYFDPHGAGSLGLIRVDAGHTGRWDRVIQSVREDISSHCNQAGFRKLAQAGRFEITVLTTFIQKAQRLTDGFALHADARRISVRVVAIPELLSFISSIPRKGVTTNTL